jgi:hypothetical protein
LPEFQRLPLPMFPVLIVPLLLKLNCGCRLTLIDPWPPWWPHRMPCHAHAPTAPIAKPTPQADGPQA